MLFMTHQYRLSFINNTNRDQTNLYVYMQTQAGLYVYMQIQAGLYVPPVYMKTQAGFLLSQKTRHSFSSHSEIY